MAGGQGNGKRGVSVSWLLFGAKGVKYDRIFVWARKHTYPHFVDK
jgi:hypothetical protein